MSFFIYPHDFLRLQDQVQLFTAEDREGTGLAKVHTVNQLLDTGSPGSEFCAPPPLLVGQEGSCLPRVLDRVWTDIGRPFEGDCSLCPAPALVSQPSQPFGSARVESRGGGTMPSLCHPTGQSPSIVAIPSRDPAHSPPVLLLWAQPRHTHHILAAPRTS